MRKPRLRRSSRFLPLTLLILAGSAVQAASPFGARPPVYALVELQRAPTAVQYHEALAVQGQAAATNVAVSQLAAVKSDQAAFTQQVAGSGLKGMQEIYRVQRVYNGILYLTPPENVDRLKAMPGVKAVHFITPKELDNSHAIPFMGVQQLWANAGLPVHGEGIPIGIIDTGVDYTHANFGGPGTVAAYTSNNKNIIEPGSFPTAKVVGGSDFAGATYNAASAATATPTPDLDPLDGNGHGSHVAGTITGFGVTNAGATYAGNYDLSLDPTTLRIGPGRRPQGEPLRPEGVRRQRRLDEPGRPGAGLGGRPERRRQLQRPPGRGQPVVGLAEGHLRQREPGDLHQRRPRGRGGGGLGG